MSEIVQGDSGTIIQATISDDNGIVDISGCSVTFTIKSSTSRNVKEGTVVDGVNGLCQVVLDASDTVALGTCIFQVTITFPNGNVFSSSLGKFKVDLKI